jgi:chromosome segregation ATPase
MTCPNCGKTGLKVRAEYLGQIVKCKNCGDPFRVLREAAADFTLADEKARESDRATALADARAERDALAQRVAELESNATQGGPSHAELESLWEQLTAARTECDRLHREHAETRTISDGWIAEAERLREELRVQEQGEAGLRKEVGDLRARLESSELRFQQTEAARLAIWQDQEAKKDRESDEIRRARDELDAAVAARDRTAAERDALRGEWESAVSLLEAERDALRRDSDAAVSRLEDELQALRAGHDAAHEHAEGAAAGLRAERDAAVERANRAESDRDDARLNLDAFQAQGQSEAQTRRVDLDSALARLHAVEAERDELKRSLESARAAVAAKPKPPLPPPSPTPAPQFTTIAPGVIAGPMTPIDFGFTPSPPPPGSSLGIMEDPSEMTDEQRQIAWLVEALGKVEQRKEQVERERDVWMARAESARGAAGALAAPFDPGLVGSLYAKIESLGSEVLRQSQRCETLQAQLDGIHAEALADLDDEEDFGAETLALAGSLADARAEIARLRARIAELGGGREGDDDGPGSPFIVKLS